MAGAPLLLETLVRAWSRSPHPRLADAVDAIAEHALVDAPREALSSSRSKADRAAWRAVEQRRDLLDFPRLLVGARGGLQAEVAQQFRALAAWKDPRYARGVLRLLEAPPYAGIKSRPLIDQLLASLEDSGDVRIAPEARALAGRYLSIVNSSTGGRIVEALERIADVLEARAVPALSEEEAARCAEAESLAPPRTAAARASPGELETKVTALVQVVCEHLDDDAPRAALADLLLEAGDARGEFIRRQLAGERVDDLLKDPAVATWMQPLKLAGECTFTRGFVDQVRLYRTGGKTADHPAWRTVRRVHEVEKLSLKDTVKLLDSARLGAVRAVGTLSESQFHALPAVPRPWTQLALSTVETPVSLPLSRFPDLEELTVSLAADLPESFLAQAPKLRTLQLTVRGRVPSGALAALSALRLLRLRAGTSEDLTLPASLVDASLSGHFERLRFESTRALTYLRCPASALRGVPVLESLRTVDLELDEQAPSQLEALAAVEHLELSAAQRLTPPPRLLAPLQRLQSVRLRYSLPLAKAHLEGLERLVHLEGLWVEPLELPHLPALLSLECMAPRSLGSLEGVLKNNPQLEYLDLQWNSSSPLYFYGSDFERAKGAYEQLRRLVEPSGVRVLRYHDEVALVRGAHGGWSAVLQGRRAGEGSRIVEGPLRVFGGK